MVINTNTSAEMSARLFSESQTKLNASLARLSSGSKIVQPQDDAAGLAESIHLSAQINRISAANNNVGNAVSYSQTQDGFLQKVGSVLDRMSELAVAAQDATKTDTDRSAYNFEFTKLGSYINDLATKDFNGVSLFAGTGLNVTIDGDANKVTTTGVNLTAATYTSATGSAVDTVAHAQSALIAVKAAVTQLASDRGSVGANISVLSSYTDQLSVLKNNLSAASSRITDVDVAEESTNYAKANILVQAGTAMLAQANSMPNSVLRLLQ